ncbi:MAG: sigma-70 family RNA polymerase sigma factor [Anaerolineae bacterium]
MMSGSHFKSNAGLRVYLDEISQVPLLDAEEEARLGKKIHVSQVAKEKLQKGALSEQQRAALWHAVQEGREAARQLAEANLRLVVSVAKKYSSRGIPLVDLVQEGNLGLLRAVQKYDYRLGYRFSTYATYWIRQAVSRAVAEHSRSIRLPSYISDMGIRLHKASSRLQQRLGREPTIDELVLETGLLSGDEKREIAACFENGEPLPPEYARCWKRAKAKVRLALASMLDVLSLESPLDDEGEMALKDALASDGDEPFVQLFNRSLEESLGETLAGLSERERLILRFRFELDGAERKTLRELGQELGVTRERVRQIQERALEKLRKRARKENLAAYLS